MTDLTQRATLQNKYKQQLVEFSSILNASEKAPFYLSDQT